jgi:hypothetical protein
MAALLLVFVVELMAEAVAVKGRDLRFAVREI